MSENHHTKSFHNMKHFIFFALTTLSISAFAQPIVGSYEQLTISGPDEYINSPEDVSITRDPQSSKKIWISGLFARQRFYAILDTQTEDGSVYNVPKQKVGNYQINIGCLVYDNEENQVVISLNNKQDCAGLSGPIHVTTDEVRAGDIRVGRNGKVKAGGVEVNNKPGEVKVDTKAMFEGIQYIGQKKSRR